MDQHLNSPFSVLNNDWSGWDSRRVRRVPTGNGGSIIVFPQDWHGEEEDVKKRHYGPTTREPSRRRIFTCQIGEKVYRRSDLLTLFGVSERHLEDMLRAYKKTGRLPSPWPQVLWLFDYEPEPMLDLAMAISSGENFSPNHLKNKILGISEPQLAALLSLSLSARVVKNYRGKGVRRPFNLLFAALTTRTERTVHLLLEFAIKNANDETQKKIIEKIRGLLVYDRPR